VRARRSRTAIEFLRHQMERNVAAGECIGHDEIVGLIVAVRNTRRRRIDARLGGLAHSKYFLAISITPGSSSTVSIVAWKKAPDSSDRAAEAEDQDGRISWDRSRRS